VRLGGSYLLRVELTKEEIAKLFYETHSEDIVRMFRSFVEDEDRQKRARRLERLRQSLATQEEQQEGLADAMRCLMGEGPAVWTEQDDKDIKYGEWNVYTAKDTRTEEGKVHPPKVVEEIWPHWSEGIPTKLCRRTLSPSFYNGVHHYAHECHTSLEL